MTYIYDILLNFQKQYYDFYEWNQNDEITHVRKVPLFLISQNDFNLLKISTVQFDKSFCEKIFNKTEKFKKINICLLNYVFLVSDGKEVMAIKLGKNGVITHKSSLLLDEADEVTELATDLNQYKLLYKIIKSEIYNFQTRKEKEDSEKLDKLLVNLYNHKDDDKIFFLYLDCFEKKETDINKAFQKLEYEIKTCGKKMEKIKDFFKLFNQK